MTSFVSKKIVSHQTVPEVLRSARQQKKDSLDDIGKQLNIQPKYLQALEDGAYEQIPGEIYAKQWLRKYGEYLNLDITWLVKEYKHERGVQMQFSGFDLPHQEESTSWLAWLTPKAVKIAAVVLLSLAFTTYLGIEVKNILEPPQLAISQPNNNTITHQRLITLSGSTNPEIEITINNEVVLADQQGNFSKEITLSPGLNILEVVATKKHGATNQQTISIFRRSAQVDDDGPDSISLNPGSPNY